MQLFEPIYVYSVHLESGELVKKYASTREPPPVGKKLILDIDERYTRFTVLHVGTAIEHNYKYFVLKVSKDHLLAQM
jgi:hypothetical protein